jgi:hypothetical protein
VLAEDGEVVAVVELVLLRLHCGGNFSADLDLG